MKNKLVFVLVSILMILSGMTAFAQEQSQVKTKEVLSDGTVVVNTTDLCSEVRGFRGATPIEMKVKNGTIITIKALPNDDTPDYFLKATSVFSKFKGKTLSEASEMKVDAVSGATFSSKALIENVKKAVQEANKKQTSEN